MHSPKNQSKLQAKQPLQARSRNRHATVGRTPVPGKHTKDYVQAGAEDLATQMATPRVPSFKAQFGSASALSGALIIRKQTSAFEGSIFQSKASEPTKDQSKFESAHDRASQQQHGEDFQAPGTTSIGEHLASTLPTQPGPLTPLTPQIAGRLLRPRVHALLHMGTNGSAGLVHDYVSDAGPCVTINDSVVQSDKVIAYIQSQLRISEDLQVHGLYRGGSNQRRKAIKPVEFSPFGTEDRRETLPQLAPQLQHISQRVEMRRNLTNKYTKHEELALEIQAQLQQIKEQRFKQRKEDRRLVQLSAKRRHESQFHRRKATLSELLLDPKESTPLLGERGIINQVFHSPAASKSGAPASAYDHQEQATHNSEAISPKSGSREPASELKLPNGLTPGQGITGVTPALGSPQEEITLAPQSKRLSRRSRSLAVDSVPISVAVTHPEAAIFASKDPYRPSLAERAAVASQSRVLAILKKPLISEQQTKSTPNKKVKRGSLEQKLYVPQVDPAKIVLEMDIIDKEKLNNEITRMSPTPQLSKAPQIKPNSYEISDQVDIVRRQLVLAELGIKVPLDQNGYVDVPKLYEIKLLDESDLNLSPEKQRQLTCLRNLKAKDPVLTEIKPTFPIQQITSDALSRLKLIDRATFAQQLQQIVGSQSDLTAHAEQRGTTEMLQIKQGIFRQRLDQLNSKLDSAFAKASELVQDDKLLHDTYLSQIRQERGLGGKQIFNVPSSDFEVKWKKTPHLTTHKGVEITNTGLLQNETYLKRELHLKQLKARLKKKDKEEAAKARQKKSSIDVTEVDLLEQDCADERSQVKKKSEKIQVKKEDKEARRGSVGADGIDVISTLSSPAKQKEQSELLDSQVSVTPDQQQVSRFRSLAHKCSSDPNVLDELQAIERELFDSNSSDNRLEKLFGFSLTPMQRKALEKYHSGMAINSATAVRLASVVQLRLLKELSAVLEEKFAGHRQLEEISREKEQFVKEQAERKKAMIEASLKKVVQKCQFERALLDYVAEDEAALTDEEYNVFDQMAAGLSEQDAANKIEGGLKSKLDRLREQMQAEEKSKAQLDKILTDQNLQEQLKKTMRTSLLPGQKNLTENSPTRNGLHVELEKTSISIEENPGKQRARGALQVLILQEIAKIKKNTSLLSGAHQTAFSEYLKICEREQVMPLPLLNGVKKPQSLSSLTVEDYTVNSGQVRALASVLGLFGPNTISRVFFSNTAMQDEDLTCLLKGIKSNPGISFVELVNEKLQEKAVRSMCSLLDGAQAQLQSLALSHVKVSEREIKVLCEAIGSYRNLKELSLINFKLGLEACEHLASGLLTNTNLSKLDLSWSEIQGPSMITLTKTLGENKTLVDVSLQHLASRREYCEKVAENLHAFIKRNHSLQHLNLSFMYFSAEEVCHVMQAVRQSRSLQSIHLTGNETQGDRVRLRLRRIMQPRIRIKTNDEERRSNKQVGEKDLNQSDSKEEKIVTAKDEPEEGKCAKNKANGLQNDDGLVYCRVLGHFEMPRSHRWIETRECWLCHGHSYTLILASKSLCQKHFVRPKPTEIDALASKITQKAKQSQLNFARHRRDFQEHEGSDQDDVCFEAYFDPVTETFDHSKKRHQYFRNLQVTGAFTNWSCKPLQPLPEFLRRLEKNKQSNVRVLELDKDWYQEQLAKIKVEKRLKDKVKEEATNRKRAFNEDKLKICNNINGQKWQDGAMEEAEAKLLETDWLQRLLSLLPFRQHTNFVVEPSLLRSLDLMSDGGPVPERVYAYACFLPPGKHQVCILHNTSDDSSQEMKGLYTSEIKSKPRQHQIPQHQRRILQFRAERKFFLEQSVFRDWQEPDSRDLIVADLQGSKVHQLYPEIPSLEGTEVALAEHGRVIVELFIHLIGRRNYSTISQADFSWFCHQAGIVIAGDKSLTPEDVDQIFVGTTTGSRTLPGKPTNALSRSEFVETLVRIAYIKYLERGLARTLPQAVQMLIKNHLLSRNLITEDVEEFRRQQVWTLKVDDLLRSNMGPISDVYRYFSDPGHKQAYLNLRQAQKIGRAIGLTEDQTTKCYCFSKMIVANELADYHQYQQLKLSEFCEFLVRIAAIFQPQEQQPLIFKLQKVMDVLFPLVGKVRYPANEELDVSSESDYATDD